jgi:hypothetical protein
MMPQEKSEAPDIARAKLDPGAVFAGPEEVRDDPRLSAGEKADILRRWEYDARELSVAEEEGMAGGEASLLDRIEAALHAVIGYPEAEDSSGPAT